MEKKIGLFLATGTSRLTSGSSSPFLVVLASCASMHTGRSVSAQGEPPKEKSAEARRDWHFVDSHCTQLMESKRLSVSPIVRTPSLRIYILSLS